MIYITDRKFEIPSKYFANYHKVKHVILSDYIKIIGKYTFKNYQKLEMITIPKELYTTGKECFHDCVILKIIYLPTSLHYLHKPVFKYCLDLQFVSLPDTMNSLGCHIFLDYEIFEFIHISPYLNCIQYDVFNHIWRCSCETRKFAECKFYELCCDKYWKNCFTEYVNLKMVVLARITNIILPKIFSSCQSVEYVG